MNGQRLNVVASAGHGQFPTEPLLSLEGVGRRFGGLVAVEDVSFTLASGELVGLIGPNGAGKTTLFNLITGFTPPSSGEIRWRQKIITGAAVHRIARLGITRTFQNLRVFPNLTVFDNVSVGAIGRYRYGLLDTLLHRAARAKQVGEATWRALDQTGLLPYANELAANLSYGKRKYLEIARALAFDPQLLILDEPAAGLNDTETGELSAFLNRLNRQGLTLLLVEHDLNLVMNLCQRVLVLASGRLLAQGTPAEILANPAVQDVYLGSEEAA
ncbi:ABC transporter ATP-binding protein [Sodalis sp. dw_96]|uniref:ABC transporter ATP-binding protein n=1 Tax=Sodalis sp. dw_96 TaxID=2719794 RepID=UPI001BD50221|nr:ABC transporter ATP-binding protein [Sodalis sp. dw_96]